MKKIIAGIIMFVLVFCTIGNGVALAAASDVMSVEYRADFGSAPSGDTVIKSAAATKWFEDENAIWYGSKKNGWDWDVAGFARTDNDATAKIIVWPGGEADLKFKPKLGEYIFDGLRTVKATLYTGFAGNDSGSFAEVRCMVSKDAASYIAFGTEIDIGRLYYSKDGKKSYIGGEDTVSSGTTINIELTADKNGINYAVDGHSGRIVVKDKQNRDVNTEYPIVLYGGLANDKQVLFSNISVGYDAIRPLLTEALPCSAIIGGSGAALEKRSILGNNAADLQSHFSTTGGTDEWITDESGNTVGLKYTFSGLSTNNTIFGTGKKGEASKASFGITDDNFKYSELEFEIKTDGIKAQNIGINFGFTPVSDKWADYEYYGRRLNKAVSLGDYAEDIGEWQKITIPLCDFDSERTAQYCVPGTEIWTYEKVDWSKLNLIHISAAASSESSALYIRNVSFNIARFVDCTVEYGLADSEMNVVKNIKDACGGRINCVIRVSNPKSTSEKIMPLIIAYKDGKTVYAEKAEIELQPKTEKIVRAGSFQVPKNTDGFVVKAMILGQCGEVYGDGCIIK